MKLKRGWRVSIIILVLSAPAALNASERQSRCYRIDEARERLDHAQHVFCMTSSDLKRYPKSVVTFTLLKTDEQVPKGRILAKRHYSMLGPGQYGSKSAVEKPQVVFVENDSIVHIRFLKASDKPYHYKLTENLMVLRGLAQDQTLQQDKPEIQ